MSVCVWEICVPPLHAIYLHTHTHTHSHVHTRTTINVRTCAHITFTCTYCANFTTHHIHLSVGQGHDGGASRSICCGWYRESGAYVFLSVCVCAYMYTLMWMHSYLSYKNLCGYGIYMYTTYMFWHMYVRHVQIDQCIYVHEYIHVFPKTRVVNTHVWHSSTHVCIQTDTRESAFFPSPLSLCSPSPTI